jgi:hypothetical protein
VRALFDRNSKCEFLATQTQTSPPSITIHREAELTGLHSADFLIETNKIYRVLKSQQAHFWHTKLQELHARVVVETL